MKLYQLFRSSLLMLFAGTASYAALASEPAGYYTSCENKSGKNLLTALYAVIGPHTTVSYDALLDLYKTSDVYPEDGKIWDMYSTKHWTPGTTCGSYSNVGDCYNREHSMPKSWFSKASPMYSDAFHLYPTDGKVNGQRSNYPYGECARGTNLGTHNGVTALGRLGASTFSGYSGTVFEPDDEYKGDFARSYFYMAACYNDRIGGWNSDMLDGSSFPAFTTWAKNLLLKWHRQDPVSKKELDRNEAVYARQRNRNPFIDHPEMVEHIWGDKSTSAWSLNSSSTTATINRPADGSRIDLGVSAVGYILDVPVSVLTTGATSNVTFSVSGTGFRLVQSSVSASAANAGTTITLRYAPTAAGTHTGTLVVTAGTVKATVTLAARAINGLPVGEAYNITTDGFSFDWVYVGDDDNDGNYQLVVSDAEGMLPGYPANVRANAGKYTVTGLETDTDYSYYMYSESLTSEVHSVRTGTAQPAIDFLFDGNLQFITVPGEPSEVAELLISADNIEGDFTVEVDAPFQISLDRTAWATKLTLSEDDSRLYMRLFTDKAGTFETDITARWGNYVFDDATVSGIVTAEASFFEDFEEDYPNATNAYTTRYYTGSACKWMFADAIFAIRSGQDPAHSGDNCVRFGKNQGGIAQMEEDRTRGIGQFAFWARCFGNDADTDVAVEYSTDQGSTWTEAGRVNINGKDYAEYKVHVGVAGNVRARISQINGKRWILDDVSITDHSAGVDDPMAPRHRWDAYSLNGALVVSVKDAGVELGIYSLDGKTLHQGCLPEGTHTFDGLAAGTMYIVASGDFTRPVIIR